MEIFNLIILVWLIVAAKSYETKQIPGEKNSFCQCVPSYQCEVYRQDGKHQGIRPLCSNTENICCLVPELRLNNKQKKNRAGAISRSIAPRPSNYHSEATNKYTKPEGVAPMKRCSRLLFYDKVQFGKFENTMNPFTQQDWSVFINNSTSANICEGLLVDEKIVLTIGNCVHGQNKEILEISLQKSSLPKYNGLRPRKVAQVLFHPEYKFNNPSNNLALLFLDKAFNSKDHPRYACLPDESDKYVSHHKCITKQSYISDGKYSTSGNHLMLKSYMTSSSDCSGSHGNGPLMCTYSPYDPPTFKLTQSSPVYCQISNDHLSYKVAGLFFSSSDPDPYVPYQQNVDLAAASDWIKNYVKLPPLV